jgi:hypothetical protein
MMPEHFPDQFNKYHELEPKHLDAANDNGSKEVIHKPALDPLGSMRVDGYLQKYFHDFVAAVADVGEQIQHTPFIGRLDEYQQWLVSGRVSTDILADLRTALKEPEEKRDPMLMQVWLEELRERVRRGSLEPTRQQTQPHE